MEITAHPAGTFCWPELSTTNQKGAIAFFEVKDCDAAAGRARELGAQVYVPPSDIPKVGRFSVIADPQGAVFAIFQLRR